MKLLSEKLSLNYLELIRLLKYLYEPFLGYRSLIDAEYKKKYIDKGCHVYYFDKPKKLIGFVSVYAKGAVDIFLMPNQTKKFLGHHLFDDRVKKTPYKTFCWGADTTNYPSFSFLYRNDGVLTSINEEDRWCTGKIRSDHSTMTPEEYKLKRIHLYTYKNEIVKPRYLEWVEKVYNKRYKKYKQKINQEISRLGFENKLT